MKLPNYGKSFLAFIRRKGVIYMLRMVDIIEKKRNGETLTKEEISFFVDGYTNGVHS